MKIQQRTDPMEQASQDLLTTLRENRLLAIIRGTNPDACVNTALALIQAGITVLEVSLTTNEAVDVISRIARVSEGRAIIGAGTVLTAGQVHDVHKAGAQFIVTPCLAPSTQAAVDLGLPLLVGALTPAEVYAAACGGATAVKLFPASVGGPAYLKALRDPFPDISFVPVGGVGRDSVTDYLRAGALAVGAGSPLTGDAPRGGSMDNLRVRAEAFIEFARADGQDGQESHESQESQRQWTS
jgi:2-dehydro-3-deoxyphosphogluconate aldolase/(4S)-4-hydroxy-2-oxoglutarate aldolase